MPWFEAMPCSALHMQMPVRSCMQCQPIPCLMFAGKHQYHTSCENTNPSKVQEQLYGHHTGG